MTFCEECFEKQRKIDELEEKIVLLKAKLKRQQRTAKEGLFGSSTPSSKKPRKSAATGFAQRWRSAIWRANVRR